MTTMPDLSILIVNWNSVHFLERCLQSVYHTTRDLHFEIVVVDNASYDGSRDMVKEKFPQVHFIQNTTNEGFARANNRAFLLSSGQYVLFLNPDTEVVGTALVDMVRFLERVKDAGIVGPRLLNSDLTVQTTSIMTFPSIINEALDLQVLHRTFPSFPLWNVSPLFRDPDSGGAVVEAVSGACMMIRRQAFEQVGLFSTNFFMFTEDLDLCYKVLRARWKTYYFGGATLVHHGGRSTASAPDGFRAIMIHASHVEFIRSRYGGLRAFFYKKTMALVAAVRLTVGCALLISTLGLVHRQRLRPAFSKWWTILRWATSAGHAKHGFVPAAPQRQDLSRPSGRHCETVAPFRDNRIGPSPPPQRS